MQWQGISEFVAVAETQSFTKAGIKLAISTAQISRQVSMLEQRLNSKLLYRTTRNVSVTQEGQLFYQHCRSVLDGLAAAENAISNLQRKPQGKIRLSAPVTYGEQVILPIANDFMLEYPEIEIEAMLSNRRIDIIEQGFDIAIRIGHLSDSSMMAKKLTTRVSHVCAAPSYIERFGAPTSLAQLTQHQCLLGTLDYWRFADEKQLRVHGRVRYNSGFSLLDAALKGLGIVQLPDHYVVPYIEQGLLVELLPDVSAEPELISALYPHNRQLSPKIKLFVEFLSAQVAND